MRPVQLLAGVVFSFAIVCSSVSTLAESSAVLKSTGSVALNGAGVPATTAIFSGDTVSTASGAVLTISEPGSTVLLPQNSQLTFKGRSVSLADGRATITTTKGMSVTADHYLIAPGAEGSSQYEIEKSGDALVVRASRGPVTIQLSGKTVTLAEGQVAALNAQKGLLSVQAANPAGTAQSSNTTLKSLQESLTSNDGADIPLCPNVSLCQVPPSVSGHKPCRCRRF